MGEGGRREPGETARAFHQATKHSFDSVRRRGHFLDWNNKPHPFKVYEGVPRVPLPDLRSGIDLGRILRFGAGVSRTRTFPDGQAIHFRTYASAGALYPVEVYAVGGDGPGLPAGVYHFDPADAALARLRDGDFRGWHVRATADDSALSGAPVAVILTGIPWRTAWKYAERGYRHLYWDAGMILANALALAGAAGVPAEVILGFVDQDLEMLLGLDGVKEFPLCVVALGTGDRALPPPAQPEPLAPATRPLSPREQVFEAVSLANDAGRLSTPAEVRAWRDVQLPSGRPGSSEAEWPDPVEEVIARRGSARFFDRTPMPIGVLSDVLDRATRGIPTDYANEGSSLIEPYLIAIAVDGLAPGAYAHRDGELVPLKLGNFRRAAGYLCLEQRLAADAAATVFLMADLDEVLAVMGDRGYRAAQLEGGIAGGMLYLGAYAHQFGATGLTFYDDEVTEFFSPDAAGKSCMLVVAMGGSPRLATGRRTRYNT
jgi:SagB-type dehydrogenase family enzyme